METILKAKDWIGSAQQIFAFTGAGMSVESGIPPFRGKDGIYGKYNEQMLKIEYFLEHPEKCWPVIFDIFYRQISQATPNKGHYALAKAEQMGILKGVITQNIDGLHSKAGTQHLVEFHGSCNTLVCYHCGTIHSIENIEFDNSIPYCPGCNKALKPNFVFFGESIPHVAYDAAMQWMQKCDLLLVVGTSGLVFPAASIPQMAAANGAKLVFINTAAQNISTDESQLYIQGTAGDVLQKLFCDK